MTTAIKAGPVLELQRLGRAYDAHAALRQFGLADGALEWPARLSGEQRQRVALARALIHDPQLLLLDAPPGAFDAPTRIGMQTLIESPWRERGFAAFTALKAQILDRGRQRAHRCIADSAPVCSRA
ncbi:ATP-binding cassette domain-containing protein [Noviherbaspirillum sp. DKR-6]|uniref:ATP-binding cassette domain-containing protein n=1 Tax=Noviherbaspirillum pedocola TaxID=2801341 RepID=A0A934SRU5_9BURK|nr:ATP-binding cassette domain-containing protein [Noviherbaspirillum pedocola]